MARFGPSPHWTLIAAMSLALALAVAAGLGARGLDRLGAAREQALSEERIARLIAPQGQAAAQEARTALASDPDVAAARLIPPEEAARLVAGWAQGQDLPAAAFADLRLIAVQLEPTAPADAAVRIEADLAEQGLSIEIAEPGPAARSAVRRTGADQFGLIALAAAFAAAGLVGFAARAAGASQAKSAALLASLGATRAQAQGLISGPIAMAGLQAGLLAAFLAGAAGVGLVALAPGLRALAPSATAPLAMSDLLPLLAAPILGWIAAASGARAAAGRAFDQADYAR